MEDKDIRYLLARAEDLSIRINSSIGGSSSDLTQIKIQKAQEEATEVKESYEKGDGTLLSEVDDLLFVVVGLYNLLGSSVKEGLQRSCQKNEERLNNGYDYTKKANERSNL